MKNHFAILLIVLPLILTGCKSESNKDNSLEEPEWKFSSTMHWQLDGEAKINQGTHKFGDWILEKAATCIEDGIEYKECATCHYKKTQVVPKQGHKYGDWVETGDIFTKTCSECLDVITSKREKSIVVKTPFGGSEFDLCDPIIRDLINHKDDENYVATHLMTNRCFTTGKTHDNQNYLDIEFTDSNCAINEEYTFTIATDDKFANIVDQITTKDNKVRVNGILVPGVTYYYKFDSASGNYSETDYFLTTNSPVRYISSGSVKNMRDLGGWEAENGKHVKYGLVYRGAGLNDAISSMNADSKRIFEKLEMKSEIDLRQDGSNPTNSWNSSYPLLRVNGGWYTDVFNNAEKIDGLRQSLTFLSNKNNYPAYFHCSYGMDRTGTLAYILLGLLGVSEHDLLLDYDLTDYSSVAGTSDSHAERALIESTGVEGQYKFNYSTTSGLRTPVYYCIQNIKDTYKSDTLQGSVEKYLLNKVGVSQTTIDNLKSNLLA